MRIALLNLPLDNNYGGNLQRYALMKVLSDLGHSVTHIYLVNDIRLNVIKKTILIFKGIMLKYVFHRTKSIDDRIIKIQLYGQKLEKVQSFYDKHTKHTTICYNIADVKRVCNEGYDAFIVGSDQVWRKDMTHSIGWQNYMFDFLRSDNNVIKIAYGVSFGKDTVTYTHNEQKVFSELYSNIDAVSVREDSAFAILKKMGCNKPIPQQVVDPTFLLNKDDYKAFFKDISIKETGFVFCYILDMNERIRTIIEKKSTMLNRETVISGISGDKEFNLPLWLKLVYDASYIITDSYHGVVFSLIFNKQFLFCGNVERGNSRVESLFRLLGVTHKLDYDVINVNIERMRKTSLQFLKNALS